jgi:hypothetical protein
MTRTMARTWSSTSEDEHTTDLIIQCGDHTFYAHKDAVCARSQKLQDACSASAEVRKLILTAHANEAD